MTTVVLTGGSGKLGRVCLAELLEHGYRVTNVDLVRPPDDPSPFVRADKTTHTLGSGLVFQSMTSSVSMNLSTLYGAQGASWTLAAG